MQLIKHWTTPLAAAEHHPQLVSSQEARESRKVKLTSTRNKKPHEGPLSSPTHGCCIKADRQRHTFNWKQGFTSQDVNTVSNNVL